MNAEDEFRNRNLDELCDSILFPNVNVGVTDGALERSPIDLSVFLSISLWVRSLMHSSVCLSTYLSFCVSVRLSFCLSFRLFDRLPFVPSIRPAVDPSVCEFLYSCLAVYLLIFLSVSLSFYLPSLLSVYRTDCLFVCLSLFLFVSILYHWPFHFPTLALPTIDLLPQNVFAISGSRYNFTCIFVGDNGLPPVRVRFQRRKTLADFRHEWLDIPETETVFQTNKTEGETRRNNI